MNFSSDEYRLYLRTGIIQTNDTAPTAIDSVNVLADSFQELIFSNPLICDATIHKDFKCEPITGDTIINLINAINGDAGMIELIINNIGGYTITLGTMFTKDIGGAVINVIANADNFISWRKIGTDIVYSISEAL